MNPPSIPKPQELKSEVDLIGAETQVIGFEMPKPKAKPIPKVIDVIYAPTQMIGRF
jgi:hypothetical protein